MTRILHQADLVYARDSVSLEHLKSLGDAARNVKIAPDFTNLVEAVLPDNFEPEFRQACIVPNHRMIEKTSTADRDRYIPFLAACARELERRDLRPYILLHDSKVDETLVPPLLREFGRPLPVVRESDPRKLKGILGTAQLVMGSRFHALVSALSQAVPSVAIGWSHKYDMLLADYGCPQCRLTASSTAEEIRDTIGLIVDERNRGPLVAGLKRSAEELKAKVAAMWREVDDAIGIDIGGCGINCESKFVAHTVVDIPA